jgi:hypothetical protein
LTALRVREIAAFLKSGFGPNAVPIYHGGAADGQAVGPGRINTVSVRIPHIAVRVDTSCRLELLELLVRRDRTPLTRSLWMLIGWLTTHLPLEPIRLTVLTSA